jgi:putative transposase
LAVILDAFSRKVVGWSLDRSLASRLSIAALEQAIATRQPFAGLVHHSDRGVQYASEEYVAVLEKHEMVPSMSRPANPYDNASCESFMKTLKREDIHANQYTDLEHLRTNVEEFIERYYNRQRLHSSLGYRSPEEFEQQARLSNDTPVSGVTLQFSKKVKEASTGLLGKGFKGHPLPQTPSRLKHEQPKLNQMALCHSKLSHCVGSPSGSPQFRCAISVPYHSIPYALTCFFSIPDQIAPCGLGCR